MTEELLWSVIWLLGEIIFALLLVALILIIRAD